MYFGTVKNGRIELEPPAGLPEGTRVRVEAIADDDPAYHLGDDATDVDLPVDLASEHDHYIYGTPKRRSG
ncbi:MAG: hypothetical protein HYY76_12090 [Acidobacteria bacterium]|nr:hypothetical protein [Acidobacteriota bacterium]